MGSDTRLVFQGQARMVNLKDSSVLDIVRYIFSLGLLIFSGVVVCYSIWEQKTSMWKQVPGWASLLIFIFVLWCLGVMEGLQIALVELKKLNPDYYKTSHPTAYKLGQLACKGDNIERFLMGRQVFVVCSVFFAAKLTTIHGTTDGFLFCVPDWVQAVFLETGLLGLHRPGDHRPHSLLLDPRLPLLQSFQDEG